MRGRVPARPSPSAGHTAELHLRLLVGPKKPTRRPQKQEKQHRRRHRDRRQRRALREARSGPSCRPTIALRRRRTRTALLLVLITDGNVIGAPFLGCGRRLHFHLLLAFIRPSFAEAGTRRMGRYARCCDSDAPPRPPPTYASTAPSPRASSVASSDPPSLGLASAPTRARHLVCMLDRIVLTVSLPAPRQGVLDLSD